MERVGKYRLSGRVEERRVTTTTMNTHATHPHPPSQSHFSFARFSEKLRDSTKRSNSSTRSNISANKQVPRVRLLDPSSNTSDDNNNNNNNDKHTPRASPLAFAFQHRVRLSPAPQRHKQQQQAEPGRTANHTDTLRVPSPVPSPTYYTVSGETDSTRDARRRSSVANYTAQLLSLFHSHSTTSASGSPATTTSAAAKPKPTLPTLPTELVSRILAHLPFYTLLHARRVSRMFAALIPGEDPGLAAQLYLRPVRSKSMELYGGMCGGFDLEFEDDSDGGGGSVEEKEEGGGEGGSGRVWRLSRRSMALVRVSEEIVFHPVVVEFNVFAAKECFRASGREERGEGEGEEKMPGGTRTKQSWRDMLVSMPPLREIRLRHGRERGLVRTLRVEGEESEGITLGMLFDALREWGEA